MRIDLCGVPPTRPGQTGESSRGTMLRTRRSSTMTALVFAAVCLAARMPIASSQPADGPVGALFCLEAAYEARSTADYAGLFTDDFRYHFSDPELQARYPRGWAREDEVASADHLFHGFVNARGETLPPAKTIRLTLDPFFLAPDSEKPDSTEWYRVASVPSVCLAIEFSQGLGAQVTKQPHAFWLVRGDAAVLPDST